MTRDEHLAWAKKRAIAETRNGNGLASMISDLRKHPELENHSGIELGLMMAVAGHLNDPHEVRKFIEGFN